MQQPVAVNEWRVRSRRHGGSVYMGATSLMALDERTNKMLMPKPMDVMEGPMPTHRTIKVRPAGNIKMSDVRSVMAGKAPLMLWEM